MTSISVLAPINTTGLGYHFQDLAYVLRDFVVDSLLPIGRAEPEILSDLLSRLRYPTYQKAPDPEKLLFMFWHPCARVPVDVKHQVLCTVWETGLTDKEVANLATFDGVAVPTHWHRDYLLSKGFSKPVAVVPVPNTGDRYGIRNLFAATDALLRFSNVGKFESRKGPEILVQTCALLDQMDHLLAREREDGKEVLFHGTLLWHNPFVRDWEKQAEALFLKHDFREIPSQLFRGETPSLEYRTRRFISARGKVELTLFPERIKERTETVGLALSGNHIGFYPTKAEGWGMPIWEGYLHGLLMVCPNYRGTSEYFRKDTFVEIPIVGEEVANDGVFFHGDRGTWGVIDPQDCANILSQILTCREYGAVKMGCSPYTYHDLVSNIRANRTTPNDTVYNSLWDFFRVVQGDL